MNIKEYIPITKWLPQYNRAQFKGDLAAGVTVGVMLIPQGMAYAMLAGLPPVYGLYASILPLILYAIFGTSRQLAVGPVAMISLLIATGVGSLAESGSAEYIQLAIILALMIGIIQLLMGVFRLGFLVNFLSHPVVSGFTSAAALIIGFSQLKHLLGINIPRSNHVHEIILHAYQNITALNSYTLGIGLVAILMILFIKKTKNTHSRSISRGGIWDTCRLAVELTRAGGQNRRRSTRRTTRIWYPCHQFKQYSSLATYRVYHFIYRFYGKHRSSQSHSTQTQRL